MPLMSGATVVLFPAATSLALCMDLEARPSRDLVLDAFHEVISGVQRLREHALVSTRITNEFFRSCEQITSNVQILQQALPFLARDEQDLLRNQLRVSVGWLDTMPSPQPLVR